MSKRDKYADRKILRNRKIQSVRLGNMRVATETQREFKPHWAKEILASFDPDQMGTIEVSFRDGAYWITDGQHRFWALCEFIGDGWEDQNIDCWVAHDMTLAEEAESFLTLNNRKTVSAFDKFRVSVTARRPTQVAIQTIVEGQGMNISMSDQEGSVSCVSTLEKIYRRDGAAVLTGTLWLAFESFGQPGLEARLLDGLALLFARYGQKINDASTVDALKTTTGGLGALRHAANAYRETLGKPVPECIAAACVDVLNKKRGRAAKLPRWFAKEAA